MRVKNVVFPDKIATKITEGKLKAFEYFDIHLPGDILWDAKHEVAIVVTGTGTETYCYPNDRTKQADIEFVYSPYITKYDIDNEWLKVNSPEAAALSGTDLLWQDKDGEMWIDNDFEDGAKQAVVVRPLPAPFPIEKPWDREKAAVEIKCLIADTLVYLFSGTLSENVIREFLDNTFNWYQWTDTRENWERFCKEHNWPEGLKIQGT